MKIAVIGAGISGLVAARRLTTQGHAVSVFEASGCMGGHAHSVTLDSKRTPVEVGFLVFNPSASPTLSGLLAELETPTREINTTYEIRDSVSDLVLRGRTLRELLTVPKNLTIPSFYRVLPDWMRFAWKTRKLLREPKTPNATLGDFLSEGGYSSAFVDQFVFPLTGTVYPVSRDTLNELPLATLLGLVRNHALLKLTPEQACHTLVGGSQDYLQRLTEGFRDQIHLNCPVASIARGETNVLLKFPHRPKERFDRVVLAVHADAALRLLADPTRHERDVLNCFEYGRQSVHIHRDDRSSWDPKTAALWSIQHPLNGRLGAALSFRVAKFQQSYAADPLSITVASDDQPPPAEVLESISFRRPVFSSRSLQAQRRFNLINGSRRTFFCGSYWGHGFHEDAVRSAEDVVKLIAREVAWPQDTSSSSTAL